MLCLRYCLLLWACLPVASLAAAESPAGAPRIIERVPRTPQEVAELLSKSDLPCVQLAAGLPLVQTTFDHQVYDDLHASRAGSSGVERLALDAGRWPAIAFATLMTQADRESLPFFTSGAILDVVNNSYISLQARVLRPRAGGEPHLDSVPIAGIGTFGASEQTAKFAAMQQVAMKNVRGLGLFVKPGQPREPRSLRTLVVGIQGSLLVPDEKTKDLAVVPTWELLLMRLRAGATPPDAPAASAVALHAFGTTEGLTRLVYFKPYITPAGPDDCAIQSTIRITHFSLAGQVPAGRAAHKVRFEAAQEYALADLDDYAARAGMTGDALANLTEILDAIVDGKLE